MCGAPDGGNINWNLRLRGCEDCFETNLVSDEDAHEAYPNTDYLYDVFQLIPHTTRHFSRIPSKLYGRVHVIATRRKPTLYYSAHIKRMLEIWTGYQLRVEYGIEGAHKEFEEFKQRREIEVQEQLGSAEGLKSRTEEMEDQLIDERREAIIAKLVELGHDPRDVQNAVVKAGWRHGSVFEVPAPLSDAGESLPGVFIQRTAIDRGKALVEPMVAEECLTRTSLERAQERMPIENERKDAAKGRYAILRKNYDASPDNLLPDDSVFLDIPMIKEVIESDGDDVAPTMFDSAFKRLPEYFNQWRKERRVDLASMLLEKQAPGHELNGAKRDPAIAESEGILLLATSVFNCCSNDGAQNEGFHWFGTVGEHLNRVPHGICFGSASFRVFKCVQVIPRWIEQAKKLVEAVGLSPGTATQKDMDERDARFYCKSCSAKKWGGRLARSWRNCLLHLGIHGAGRTIKLKGYEILSTQARADIKAKEAAVSAWETIEWNQVAITAQGVAVNSRGSRVELKAPPSQPRAMKNNLKATASPSNSTAAVTHPKPIASTDLTADSQATAVKGLRCKLCLNSNREFALPGLMAHAMAK
ncbi:hypothetical protein FRC01_005209 [Tulasnella sp. 417]|nr:hypothetical protein FRC01_005209 [Tulasnella sp. 417]